MSVEAVLGKESKVWLEWQQISCVGVVCWHVEVERPRKGLGKLQAVDGRYSLNLVKTW